MVFGPGICGRCPVFIPRIFKAGGGVPQKTYNSPKQNLMCKCKHTHTITSHHICKAPTARSLEVEEKKEREGRGNSRQSQGKALAIADVHLCRLQSVQNAAARLISGARRHDHITPILATLQRLHFVSEWSSRRRRWCGSGAARRSAKLPGRPLCAGGVYGRSSPVSLCSLRASPGVLDSDVYWLCCVWPQDLELTTSGPPITRTVAIFIQAPAQDPLVCSSTRQCWLQLCMRVV